MAYAYKRLRRPGGGFIDEHRLVMERALGRVPRSDEIVHHKNEDPRDNRLSNLELTNRAEHASHHTRGRTCQPELRQRLSELKRGRTPSSAPLSAETVRSIRAARQAGEGPTAIAKRFNVLKVTVINICNGKRYAGVA